MPVPGVDNHDLGLVEGPERGVAVRCEVVGGDFFESTQPSGDVYLMSHIAHDPDDERSVAILRNCRKTIDPDGAPALAGS